MISRSTTEKFIQRSRGIHGNKYDYSLAKYVRNSDKVKIICPVHGVFEQLAANHIAGSGCFKCGILYTAMLKTLSTDKFVHMANKVHKYKYDYSETKYVNCKKKVKITCKKHGSFLQLPSCHLSGTGCKMCGDEICGPKVMSTELFVEKAREIHGHSYDYSESNYVGYKSGVKIICKKHGFFHQRAGYHLQGHGCPKCSHIVSALETLWLDSVGLPRGDGFRQVGLVLNDREYIVDGYIADKKLVYEFCGDFWHGNPKKFRSEAINAKNKKTFGELYEKTKEKIKELEIGGYEVIVEWESDFIRKRYGGKSVGLKRLLLDLNKSNKKFESEEKPILLQG